MNQQIADKVTQIIDALQSNITIAGKESVNLAVQVAHYNAITNLAFGFGILFISLVFLLFAGLILRDIPGAKKEDDGSVGAFIFCTIIFIGTFIWSLSYLFDIFNWVGVHNPQVYLAHQIMTKFIGN